MAALNALGRRDEHLWHVLVFAADVLAGAIEGYVFLVNGWPVSSRDSFQSPPRPNGRGVGLFLERAIRHLSFPSSTSSLRLLISLRYHWTLCPGLGVALRDLGYPRET